MPDSIAIAAVVIAVIWLIKSAVVSSLKHDNEAKRIELEAAKLRHEERKLTVQSMVWLPDDPIAPVTRPGEGELTG